VRYSLLKQAVKELRESTYVTLSRDMCYAVPSPVTMPEMPEFAVQVWDNGTRWTDIAGGSISEQISLGIAVYSRQPMDRTGHRALTEDLLDKYRGVLRTLYLSTLDDALTVPLVPVTESSVDRMEASEITHLRKTMIFAGQIWMDTDSITW